MKVYLDNAATTQLKQETKEYVVSLLDDFYNPSSVYQEGRNIKNMIDDARKNVADFINANSSDNITFTSGGSASNTLAVRGYKEKNNCVILYSPICHKSILKYVRYIRNAIPLKVDLEGHIDLKYLKELLAIYNKRSFVIIDYANSEIGTVQYVQKIVDLVHFYNGTIYIDCTGSISQIQLDVKELNVDMIGFSAHKLGALKGCGVLYKKEHIKLEPLIYGNQENGLFSGTENVFGILTLGYVVKNYNYKNYSRYNYDYILNYLNKNVDRFFVIGDQQHRLLYNLYLCFEGISGEALMTLLDENGVIVSTGSACNSGNQTPSSVLQAIGVPDKYIHNGIRLTLNGTETEEELDFACSKIKNCVMTLRNLT